MKKALTVLQNEELVKLYCDGVPTRELVKQFDVSDTTVRNVLRACGVVPCEWQGKSLSLKSV